MAIKVRTRLKEEVALSIKQLHKRRRPLTCEVAKNIIAKFKAALKTHNLKAVNEGRKRGKRLDNGTTLEDDSSLAASDEFRRAVQKALSTIRIENYHNVLN